METKTIQDNGIANSECSRKPSKITKITPNPIKIGGVCGNITKNKQPMTQPTTQPVNCVRQAVSASFSVRLMALMAPMAEKIGMAEPNNPAIVNANVTARAVLMVRSPRCILVFTKHISPFQSAIRLF